MQNHDEKYRQLASEFVRYLEWLFGFYLTERQQIDIVSMLTRTLPDNDRSDINLVVHELTRVRELGARGADLENMRPQLQNELRSWLAEHSGPDAFTLIQSIQGCMAEVLAPGLPPLIRQAAHAYFEFASFVQQQVNRGASGTPSRAQQEAFAEDLRRRWSGLSDPQRQTVAGAPIYWDALRNSWPRMSEEQRNQYRQTWSRNLMSADGDASRAEPPPAASVAGSGDWQSAWDANLAELRSQRLRDEDALSRGGPDADAVRRRRLREEVLARNRDMSLF